MVCCIVLCCVVLCCGVLCCVVLCCVVLCCGALCCLVLFWFGLVYCCFCALHQKDLGLNHFQIVCC